MNEIELLATLRDEVPVVPVHDLASQRARLSAAIASASAPTRTASRPRVRPLSRSRRTWAAAVAASAAAAVAVTLAVAGGVPGHEAGQPGHEAGRPESAAGAVHLTAVRVLDLAARAAFAQPATTPRPDQFVYTKVRSGDLASQSWLSVDGRHDGRVQVSGHPAADVPGCASGQVTAPSGSASATSAGTRPAAADAAPAPASLCPPQPAFFPAMPTSQDQMLAYLEKTQGVRPGDLNDLAKTVAQILQQSYLLPAQRAAMYKFLATVPGIKVVDRVRDADGRPGIGVAWPFDGSRTMEIFDPATYAYLGETSWGTRGQQSGEALLQIAIVNDAGQLP